MRVVFMGSDKVALPLLEALKKKEIQLIVVSGVDKPAGRGQQLLPNDVSAWALANIENNINLLRPQKIDETFLAQLKEINPDLIFVMAYGKILKSEVIDLPRLGTWNFHASALPKLRGASPIETAIAMGETLTSVDLIRMKLALDSGPVGASLPIAIDEKMTSQELRVQVATVAAELLEKHWEALSKGTLMTLTQDESAATYCRILRKDDGWLDPNAEADALVNHIRAFAQWPGAAFVYAGERLKIYSAQALDRCIEDPVQSLGVKPKGETLPPGTVLESSGRLIIATGKGNLEILSLQRAGGKQLSAVDFLRGYPISVGEKFFGKPMRLLVDKKPFPRGF